MRLARRHVVVTPRRGLGLGLTVSVLWLALLVPALPAGAKSRGCSDPLGCVFVDRGKPVVIATLLALKGDAAKLGIDSQRGARLAVDVKGARVRGHRVRLAHFDDGCDPAVGRRSARRILSRRGVVATIGPSCSAVAAAVARRFGRRGMALISPSSTAPNLTDPATHNAAFLRTANNDAGELTRMADFVAKELGLLTAGTIDDGIGEAVGGDAFTKAFSAAGGTIVAQEQVDPGTTDFTSALQAVAAQRPDFLFFTVLRNQANLVQQARATGGLTGTPLGTFDIVLGADFLSQAGAAAENVYAAGPDFGFVSPFHFPNPDYQAVILPKYRARWGEPPFPWHAHAYDATNMVRAALKKVARRQHGRLRIGRRALLNALYATTDYPGLIGNVTCGPNGDCNPNVFVVNQVQGGQWHRSLPSSPPGVA